jgi:alcohol dehydrogenase class IV
MTEPEVWTFERLLQQDREKTFVVSDETVREKVQSILPYSLSSSFELPPGKECLIVVGGGTVIDKAKAWRADHAAKIRLVAVPSLWGSGAEVSPIVVSNYEDRKEIRVDERFVPDVRVIWPGLSQSIPISRIRTGCGDCWAHCLEGFLSPLANDSLRKVLAELIKDMLATPIANAPCWYELSARACSGQARSSVGLVHGIAHILEIPLARDAGDAQWGHAKLCSVFLWPVMCFNRKASDKFDKLMDQYAIETERIMNMLRGFYSKSDFEASIPFLEKLWKKVLRDPCTRTNSALVRPNSLNFFIEKDFE